MSAEEYIALLQRCAYRYGLIGADAEDVVMECLHAYRWRFGVYPWEAAHGDASPVAWCLLKLRAVIADHFRQTATHREVRLEDVEQARELRKFAMDKNAPIFTTGWIAPALAGVSILVGARLVYLATVLIISLLMGDSTAALRMVWMLADGLGWVPYLLWGSLAGLLTTYARSKVIWGWLLCCTIGLWVNEILWLQALRISGNYILRLQHTFKIMRLNRVDRDDCGAISPTSAS